MSTMPPFAAISATCATSSSQAGALLGVPHATLFHRGDSDVAAQLDDPVSSDRVELLSAR
jgi:hypothetical protein